MELRSRLLVDLSDGVGGQGRFLTMVNSLSSSQSSFNFASMGRDVLIFDIDEGDFVMFIGEDEDCLVSGQWYAVVLSEDSEMGVMCKNGFHPFEVCSDGTVLDFGFVVRDISLRVH